jgi:phosphoribosylformylglycinamidine cyclo-ligase
VAGEPSDTSKQTNRLNTATDSRHSLESSHYASLGASSSKAGVLAALAGDVSHRYFAKVSPDVCGDPNYFSLLHADGAGTKAIVAYLAYKETGDTSWFKGLAQDSLIMNLDDVACNNAFEGLLLSNTIGRNRFLISDEVISAIIAGYKECLELLESLGISVGFAGGETADMGDVIRTLAIDSTLFARVKRAEVIDASRIAAGDIIVGLSSTGHASFEKTPNSGIASNGFTLARHALLNKEYAERYPEIVDPTLRGSTAYRGAYLLDDAPPELGMSVGEALLSPTRPYAPIVRKIAAELGNELHAAINCTGGGQTKLVRFGINKHFIKDNLFPCPPIFELIRKSASLSWPELYSVFNMGTRVDLLCPPSHLATIVSIAKSYDIEAKQVGYVEDSAVGNRLTIHRGAERYDYSA